MGKGVDQGVDGEGQVRKGPFKTTQGVAEPLQEGFRIQLARVWTIGPAERGFYILRELLQGRPRSSSGHEDRQLTSMVHPFASTCLSCD